MRELPTYLRRQQFALPSPGKLLPEKRDSFGGLMIYRRKACDFNKTRMRNGNKKKNPGN